MRFLVALAAALLLASPAFAQTCPGNSFSAADTRKEIEAAGVNVTEYRGEKFEKLFEAIQVAIGEYPESKNLPVEIWVVDGGSGFVNMAFVPESGCISVVLPNMPADALRKIIEIAFGRDA
jgi:hypothetical protein